jgi:hypothetical protein
VFALANVVHFFAYEFAGLRAGRFAFFFVALRSLNNFFFWHVEPFVENGRGRIVLIQN